MSFDIGIWHTKEPLGDQAAGELYSRLCNGNTTGLLPHSSIDVFYDELTAQFPEINDVPQDRLDDTDYSPWSTPFDQSPAHLIISLVFSKVETVGPIINKLAVKHGLTLYVPSMSCEIHPLSIDDESDED